jgi:hypothetical protein
MRHGPEAPAKHYATGWTAPHEAANRIPLVLPARSLPERSQCGYKYADAENESSPEGPAPRETQIDRLQ